MSIVCFDFIDELEKITEWKIHFTFDFDENIEDAYESDIKHLLKNSVNSSKNIWKSWEKWQKNFGGFSKN